MQLRLRSREAPATEAVTDDVAVVAGTELSEPVVIVQPEVVDERRRLGFGAKVAALWLGVLVALAVTAPWLPFLDDPASIDPLALSQGPSAEHWLGADDVGR